MDERKLSENAPQALPDTAFTRCSCRPADRARGASCDAKELAAAASYGYEHFT
jgi:hypothetical protein